MSLNTLDRPKHRNLEIDLAPLRGAERRKSRIGDRCRNGAPLDDLDERQLGLGISNAASQFAFDAERDERARAEIPGD